MFDTSGSTVYSQLSQSLGRSYDSLRGRMHAAGNEHGHPPMDSAALEQLSLQISTIDGVSLTEARAQIDRFRGTLLPDATWHRITVESTVHPRTSPDLGIAMV
jgi:hypothetical protein